MSSKQYMTEEEFREMFENLDLEKEYAEQKAERDAYFNDPANAEEIAEMEARMDMVIALYKARTEAGLTQKELAEKMGVSQASINQIERGRRNLTLTTIRRYAAACGKKMQFTFV